MPSSKKPKSQRTDIKYHGPFPEELLFHKGFEPSSKKPLSLTGFHMCVEGMEGLAGFDDLDPFTEMRNVLFRGNIVIEKENWLSDNGKEMLARSGVRITPQSFEDGRLGVTVQGTYRKFWTRVPGLRFNEFHVHNKASVDPRLGEFHIHRTYNVTSWVPQTYARSRMTLEREDLLAWIKQLCKNNPDRPLHFRTIEWMVDEFFSEHPAHRPSSIAMESSRVSGPGRKIHRAEIYHYFARHAERLQTLLEGDSALRKVISLEVWNAWVVDVQKMRKKAKAKGSSWGTVEAPSAFLDRLTLEDGTRKNSDSDMIPSSPPPSKQAGPSGVKTAKPRNSTGARPTSSTASSRTLRSLPSSSSRTNASDVVSQVGDLLLIPFLLFKVFSRIHLPWIVSHAFQLETVVPYQFSRRSLFAARSIRLRHLPKTAALDGRARVSCNSTTHSGR
ncbi:hypothetical protein BOTBODRAFT_58559 [Botryobasidium botryosum FD-172 SS1]|uniref:Uncharacterized protein n=1 Tax=Botryobasidium botryosum (strain FD-172 SS1) TaxID=930990 RepID=A0A067M4M7_BOTB1|nr:hypothetical protein BOTBODRAFT_58559 [Botryobasidium botryosum FD-172 SS1]